MVKNKNLFIYIFFILILCNLSLGAIEKTGNFTISYPKLEYLPYGEESKIIFYGEELTNDNYNCNAQIFDSNYAELMTLTNLINSSNGYSKEIILNSTVHNVLGIKSYNVNCNDGSNYGSVSGSFYISVNGENINLDTSSKNGILLILGYGIIAALCLWISSIFRKNPDKNLRILRNLFFYLALFHITLITGVMALASSCDNGNCTDINRFAPVTETHFISLTLILIYLIWTFATSKAIKQAGGK